MWHATWCGFILHTCKLFGTQPDVTLHFKLESFLARNLMLFRKNKNTSRATKHNLCMSFLTHFGSGMVSTRFVSETFEIAGWFASVAMMGAWGVPNNIFWDPVQKEVQSMPNQDRVWTMKHSHRSMDALLRFPYCLKDLIPQPTWYVHSRLSFGFAHISWNPSQSKSLDVRHLLES